MPTSLVASRPSDLARRLRRLTSMEAESTTRFSTPWCAQVTMEPEAVAAGLVAGDDRGRPRAGRSAAWPARISRSRASVSRAGMERSLGFWPAPTVKASFQVVQLSSRAR